MTVATRKLDAQEVKRQASGQWKGILSTLGGIDLAVLDGQHYPCPKCGGRDRFRVFDDFEQTGGLMCNQCFGQGNGDGLAALMWITGKDFRETLEGVAEHLRMTPPAEKKPEPRRNDNADPANLLDFTPWDDEAERIAARWTGHKKGVTVESIKANGGRVATYRKDIVVVALPANELGFENADVVGWTIWNAEPPTTGNPNSGKLPKYSQNSETGKWEVAEWKKVFITYGSKKGFHGQGRTGQAESVIVVEGPTDLLALWAAMTSIERDSFSVLSISTGASSRLDDWMIDLLAGKNVIIIYDSDDAGSRGAAKHYHALKQKASSVRVLKLPCPEDSKRDVRDFINEGYSFGDVMSLEQIDLSSLEPATATEKAKPREIIISNAAVSEVEGENGKTERRIDPYSINDFVELIHDITGGIPYRIGNELFIQKSDGEIFWIKSQHALVSCLSSIFQFRFIFHQSMGCVNRSELFEGLRFLGKGFDSIEHNPHEPSIPNFYYACEKPPAGDGKMLQKLIARFNPESQYDADLIACFLRRCSGG